MATERLQPVASTPSSAPSRQLQARAKVQSQDDMRQELLGSKNRPGLAQLLAEVAYDILLAL